MTILADILVEKEKEVKQLKQNYQSENLANNQTVSSFYRTFMESDQMNIIAEIKRASPSKGIINPNVNPAKQASDYQAAGASMISVLTDQPFFQGTMEDLAMVRSVVDLPILNKDFIIDEIQIDRAKDYGANVILLIAAALPKTRLEELYDYAIQSGLEVLFEVHNAAELSIAQEIGVQIIGVNNRNLKTFAVDLAITEELAKQIDLTKTLLISESGIKTTADVMRVQKAGARGILVGETMMRSKDLTATFQTLRVNR